VVLIGRIYRPEQQLLIGQAGANVHGTSFTTGFPAQVNPTLEPVADQTSSGVKRLVEVDAELPPAKRQRVESLEANDDDDDDWAFGPLL